MRPNMERFLAKKQTSANNAFLCGVKVVMNKKVYARTCKLVNDNGEFRGGIEQALTYLQQFFNRPITAQEFVELGKK